MAPRAVREGRAVLAAAVAWMVATVAASHVPDLSAADAAAAVPGHDGRLVPPGSIPPAITSAASAASAASTVIGAAVEPPVGRVRRISGRLGWWSVAAP